MNDKDTTARSMIERYNLEEMVSQAIDLAFGRKQETDNTMNNEATQMELIDDNNLSNDAAEILRVIQESNEPVGRANILARANIEKTNWTAAIQELKDQDCVVQHGTRRGAKYTVSKVSSINF